MDSPLDLDKIKILHPQKHLIFYDNVLERYPLMSFGGLLDNVGRNTLTKQNEICD